MLFTLNLMSPGVDGIADTENSFVTTNDLLSLLIYSAIPKLPGYRTPFLSQYLLKKLFYIKWKMHNPHSYFSQLDPSLYLTFLIYILPIFAELSFEILLLEYHDLSWQNFCRAAR